MMKEIYPKMYVSRHLNDLVNCLYVKKNNRSEEKY